MGQPFQNLFVSYLCLSTLCSYLPYGYYDQILKHLGQSATNSSTVWVVAPPSCEKTEFMKVIARVWLRNGRSTKKRCCANATLCLDSEPCPQLFSTR